jgi:hypothetical protein
MNINNKFIEANADLARLLQTAPSFQIADNVTQLQELACQNMATDRFEVKYELPNGDTVHEVTVVRVKNGIAVNYTEPYMRRRDPDCMLIGDGQFSDKTKYAERFGKDFSALRQETLDWLSQQDLAMFAFKTGDLDIGEDAIAVVPVNAAFFALGLAMLQGIIPQDELPEDFSPQSIIYVAPTFRHTHFNGKQVVVHNRTEELYEIFSYNLYPGPSAKKGVYGVLIDKGEQEGWLTAHCSAVQVKTPYDNIVTFMHEGASGGGKSEMLEQPHRLPDGRLQLGYNLVNGEYRYIELPRTCRLYPVCDDMAMCHPTIIKNSDKLSIIDAEDGWFLRVNHIEHYGTDPNLEKLTINPKEPLFFLNIDTVQNSTALIWEHIQDKPGVACPNPRVIVPRAIYPNIVSGAIEVDYRSFGIRTPPCTKENPSYGILGLLHLLPPALAWLWRLVAPRGFSNPSIVDTGEMSSEGVGSYWPFATGSKVKQANLLLEQFKLNSQTKNILIPNQHVGAWNVSFMPQWLTREYLARRGNAQFQHDQLVEARSPLLGYAMKKMRIEGIRISNWFLTVDTQPEIGPEVYDKGAEILQQFFVDNIRHFQKPDLDEVGRQIIECCMDRGGVADYENFFPNYAAIHKDA